MRLDARRILIYGVTGSGKTTFARKLSEATGIPWTEVDSLTWEPNWTEVPADEQIRRIERIVRGEEWILDTAYGKWLEVPLARTELIIGLDFPRWVSLGRLIGRTVARIRDHQPVCNGNIEKLGNAFSRESIILWHFRSFARKRHRIREWERRGSPPVHRFRKPSEAERWLASLRTNYS